MHLQGNDKLVEAANKLGLLAAKRRKEAAHRRVEEERERAAQQQRGGSGFTQSAARAVRVCPQPSIAETHSHPRPHAHVDAFLQVATSRSNSTLCLYLCVV